MKIYETEKVIVESHFNKQQKTMCLCIYTKDGLAIPDAINLNRAIERWINQQ